MSAREPAAGAGPGGWDHLGDGGAPGTRSLDFAVRALNTDAPGQLLVGGSFTNAGGVADADHIASWNGSAWSAVGPGLPGDVFAIAYDQGRVFVGGSFTNAGGNANADFLAVWDGAAWAPFCNTGTPPAFAGNVKALEIIGSTLYVGGEFQNGAGIAAADYLLACDLGTGAATATVNADGDFTGAVEALTADDAGNLYAAGTFINLDNILAADRVAAYNGTWSAMGSGAPNDGAVNGISRALTASGTDIYLGTDAVNVAGIPEADHVVRWDGSAWSAVGSNAGGGDGWFPAGASIEGLTKSGSRLVAIGQFQNADGNPAADVVASFDSGSWQAVGSNGAGDGPLNAAGHVVVPFDQKLYAGGNFTSAGGDPLAQFAASYPLFAVPIPTPTVTPAPSAVPTPTPSPTTTLSGPKSQALGKTITLQVACNVACSAAAFGTLNVPAAPSKNKVEKYKLGKAKKQVPAGGKVTLKLKVPKAARNPAKRALAKGKKVTAKITVTATNAAGESSSAKRTVKLKP